VTGDAPDANTGDGICQTAVAGECSLRAAVEQANATVGANTILFNIPGGGPHTIQPLSALPTITDPVFIDGYSEPGASMNTLATGSDAVLMIELDGTNVGASVSGLTITSGNSTVRGLVINRFTGSTLHGAITISGTGGNTIQGNYLGTDTTGASSLPNYQGIRIDGSNGNVIGGASASQRNVISGNQWRGILIANGASSNLIQGNYIGANAAGTAALTNQDIGLYVSESPNNTFGGAAAVEGNVVSGNTQIGIYLVGSGASGNAIQGNTVGLNAARTAPVGNGTQGVEIILGAANNTVGGAAAGAANVISANGGKGVQIRAGTGNAILTNAIYGNGGVGIDLGNDNVTANDGTTTVGQPNLLMDYPVFTAASLSGTTLTISGYIGTAPNDTDFANARVEIFKSDNDASGNGEGQTYLGFLTADANGNFSGSLTVSGLFAGDQMTATATDTSNNTSEFGPNLAAVAPFVVNVTGDAPDANTGDDLCQTATPGQCTLRAAIQQANATVGFNAITFNIPLTDANHVYYRNNGAAGTFGAPVTTTLADAAITDFDPDYPAGTARSWYRISPSGNDLNITESVIIDASTQPGYSASKGPIIEINATGISAADPNAITLTTGATTIRGLVINRGGDDGIEVDAGAGNSTIVGNYIGADASGTQGLGNGYGISVKANNILIGGPTVADRNILSGNTNWGIGFYNSASGATVQGNYIGVTATGSGALGNSGAGIDIYGSAANHTIGGVNPNEGNIIANNGGDGIWVESTAGTGNKIVGNSIYANTGEGIDLGANGVTNNDNNDPDTGPNNLQNFPVLTAAHTANGVVSISGSLNSEANKTYRLEFFANTINEREGERYLGYTTVTTPGTTPYTVTFSATLTASVVNGEYITATATDPGNNTSEFSAQVAASSGMVIWRSNGDTSPNTREWTGSAFSPAGNSAAIGDLVALQAAEAPTRDEIVVVGRTSAFGPIVGEMWDGSTWSALPINPLGSYSNSASWMADVAYESVSGDAMLVWADNTDVKFSVWNGASWTAAALLSDYATLSGGTAAVHISLAAKPGGDELALAVTDNLGKDYAYVWNGSSWSAGLQVSTGSGSSSAVAYEQQTGRAMIAYANAATPTLYYRIWDGSSWSAQSSVAVTGVSGGFYPAYIKLASDPTSNRIAVAITPSGISGSVEYSLNIWNGSAWSAGQLATASGVDQLMPGIAAAFESTSGDAIAAYGVNGSNTVRYRTWTAAGGWSAEQNGPTVGAAPRVVVLSSDPYSDRVMLTEQDGNSDLYAAQWSGSAWGSATVLDTNTGATNSQPFDFVWYRN
jgi:CSLREA domain-containing protein